MQNRIARRERERGRDSRIWKLGLRMEYGGSKRLGLPDQVIGHWVWGTVGLNEVDGLWVGGTVGLNVRRVSGMWERFKFG